MRTAAQRIAHYDARMVSSLIDPVLTAVSAQAVANFTAYAVDYVPKQDQLRNILDAAGISGAAVFAYEAYHNELYGADRSWSGPALVARATILVAKYEAVGLAGVTLRAIANTIYGLIIP